MANMEGSRETRPRRSFEECMLGFDYLERQTNGIVTAELSSLKSLLTTLTPTLIEVASKQAIVLTGQACHRMLAEIRNPSSSESSAASYSLIPAFTTKAEVALEDEVQRTHSRVQDLEKETESLLENVRDELAEEVLNTMEMMWVKRSTQSENHHRERVGEALDNLLNERKNLREKLGEAMENLRNEKNITSELVPRLAAAEGSVVEKEKALENRSRELEKSYYNDVQNVVEGRLRDERAKLADRLSTAEAKALQYAKIIREKEVLEARISQENREKALLKQAKLELEQKYKDRDDEAKALREGYDQLSNDNQVLQTEKAVLQADYDELKEHERSFKEQESSSGLRRIDQLVVSSPPVSSIRTLDRQTAELQHLDGLVATWQATLDHATAERDGSKNSKEALEGKIREVEQQLKKLKSAPPSKHHLGSNTNSTPKNSRVEKKVVVKGESAGQEVLHPSTGALRTLPKARVPAEAFPVLSSPVVPKTTPSNTWKSLRLVDVPKEQAPDAQKRSG